MTKDRSQTIEEKEKDIAGEKVKGKFESAFSEYPGYIQLPNPLMLHHVEKWWKIAIERNKGIERQDFKFQQNQWEAARDLLIEFDGWHIDCIPIGDVKDNRVPQVLVSFTIMMVTAYIEGQLHPKALQVLRSNI